MAQSPMMVTGVVTDSEGEPLIGASIYEVDKNDRIVVTAVTDYNGEFAIKVSNPKANKLKFTYVGFESSVLPIEPVMNVVLKDNSTLDEVVVTARKLFDDGTLPIDPAEITGAVQSINTKAFEGLSVSSIDDALQGVSPASTS